LDKLPFSIYDFFTCLSAGFLLIAAADYGFGGGALLNHKAAFAFDLVLVIAAYILGHVISELAGQIYERRIVAKLGRPVRNLLGTPTAAKGWRTIAKSYLEPLPAETQRRVHAQAVARKFEGDDASLFYHCHAIVKHDPSSSTGSAPS
jgi:hypothetical protein